MSANLSLSARSCVIGRAPSQKLLSLSQQQSMKPYPPKCSCYSCVSDNLALLPVEPNKEASGSLASLLCKIWATLGLLEDNCEVSVCKEWCSWRVYLHNVHPALGTAKKKASEELGEARTVWEALQKELDSRKCAGFTQISCLHEPSIPDTKLPCCGQEPLPLSSLMSQQTPPCLFWVRVFPEHPPLDCSPRIIQVPIALHHH